MRRRPPPVRPFLLPFLADFFDGVLAIVSVGGGGGGRYYDTFLKYIDHLKNVYFFVIVSPDVMMMEINRDQNML